MREPFDVLLRNATIIDGTGERGSMGTLASAEIASSASDRSWQRPVSRRSTPRTLLRRPGLSTRHTHDDRLMLSSPDMAPKVSQGITTVIAGNCGISLAPMPGGIGSLLRRLSICWTKQEVHPLSFIQVLHCGTRRPTSGTNCALLVGHTTLRWPSWMIFSGRPPPRKPHACARWSARRLRRGRLAFSMALLRAGPGCTDGRSCRDSRPMSDSVVVHAQRDEPTTSWIAAETFCIGREFGVPVVISDHKMTGQANYDRLQQTLL